MRLQGKIALITGAASGIGRAVTDLFATEGATVFAGDIASPQTPYSDGIVPVALDVTREDDWEAAVDTIVEKSGRLDVLINSDKKGIELIGPIAKNQSWQANSDGAYDHTQFQIDWQTMQATCPEGKVSAVCSKGRTRAGNRNYHFHFDARDCANCAARSRCTRAKKAGRQLCVLPQEKYERLQEARQRQKTEGFKVQYQARAGVEGTISQAINSHGVRRARYRGLARTHLQHLAAAAAINLSRAADWLFGHRPETTRVTPFIALACPA